jgi:hypothetical protein
LRVWIGTGRDTFPTAPVVDVIDDSPLPPGFVGFGRRPSIGAYNEGVTACWYLDVALPNTAAPTVSIDQAGPITLEPGQTSQLSATATGTPTPTLAWESDDEAVATVDSAGLVTAVADGSATITVEASNSAGSDDDSISVTVDAAVAPPVWEEYAALWDDVRGRWGLPPGAYESPDGKHFWAAAPGGLALRGGIHDPALLAWTEAGSGKAFRTRASVLINGRGRWVGHGMYYGQRSVTAGVGVAGYGYGRVGEPPSWFGFWAGVRIASPAQHTISGSIKGAGRGALYIGYLDPTQNPSDRGYASKQVASRSIPRLYAYSDYAAGAYAAGLDGKRWGGGSSLPLMSVCPTCGASTEPTERWYDVEMEVSQHSPGNVLVCARIVNADGVDVPLPDQESGGELWHIVTVWGTARKHISVPAVTLDCAWAGYAGRSIYDVGAFQDGYAIFRGLSVTVTDPADCELEAPPAVEPAEWDEPETPDPPADWDEEWIVFGDDDETPYYWASALYPYSTNPVLTLGEQMGESAIDLVEGRSTIGQINVRVLDRRLTPADQASGHLTAGLAEDGRTTHIGRRGLRRRWVEDETDERGGYFHVLLDGMVGGVQLEADHVTYSHPLRDLRERERKQRAFTRTDGWSFFPPGPRAAWGDTGDGYLLEPVEPLRAYYQQFTPWPPSGPYGTSGRLQLFQNHWVNYPTSNHFHEEVQWRESVLESSMSTVAGNEGPGSFWAWDGQVAEDYEEWVGDLYRHEWPNVRILWRRIGETEWHTEEISMLLPESSPVSLFGGGWTGWGTPTASGIVEETGEPGRGVLFVNVHAPFGLGESHQLLANEQIEVLLAWGGPPSPDNPLHLEGMTAGELLAALYDGEHSEPGAHPIKYDAVQVATLTAPVLARLTKPIEDIRQWTEDHIYKPLGYAPALRYTEDYGYIFPVRLDPIEADADLPEIDNATVIPDGSEWSQESGSAVNLARFVYPRFYVPEDDWIEVGPDGIAVRTITRERLDAASAKLIGEAVWEVGDSSDPSIFGAIGTPQGTQRSDVPEETAAGLLRERWDVFRATRLYGAQRWTMPCHWSASKDFQVGDEVRVSVPWWPDYQTGRRGMDRVGIIVSIADPDYGTRVVTVEDAQHTIEE